MAENNKEVSSVLLSKVNEEEGTIESSLLIKNISDSSILSLRIIHKDSDKEALEDIVYIGTMVDTKDSLIGRLKSAFLVIMYGRLVTNNIKLDYRQIARIKGLLNNVNISTPKIVKLNRRLL